MKNLLKNAAFIFCVFFALIFSSCKNDFTEAAERIASESDLESESKSEKESELIIETRNEDERDEEAAYIRINFSEARTAFPTDPALSEFSLFTLYGALDEESEAELANWSSLSNVTRTSVALKPGRWNFTLRAKKGSLIYAGKITRKTIVTGDNALSFSLKCEDLGTENGGLQYKLELPTDNVDLFELLLIPYANGPEGTYVDSRTFRDGTDFTHGTPYTINYTKPTIASGQYWLIVKACFYKDQGKNEKVILSTYRDIVRIASGLSTLKDTSGECGKAYTVSYETDGGTWTSTGENRIVKFNSTMPEISLPDGNDIKNGDRALLGWYTNATYTGTCYTDSIPAEQRNLTLYAKWGMPQITEVYVAQTTAFSVPRVFIQGAVTVTVGTGSDTAGDGSAAHPFASIRKALETLNGEGRNCTIYVYGTVKDCAEIGSGVKAGSLKIVGADNTKDIIDGNDAGTVLSITAAIPVTIENLTIKNGKSERGGGLFIASNAEVKNCIIVDCEASRNGGGIYISGGATLTNCTIQNNKSTNQSGGGICVVGTQGTVIDNCSIMSNTASYRGGGIYNEGLCTVEGGSISTNTASDTSAANSDGIMCDSGTLILNNSAPTFSGDSIYLKTGKTITLGPDFSASGIVATISPESYTNFSTIPILDGNNVADNCTKFRISNSAYSINTSGFLRN